MKIWDIATDDIIKEGDQFDLELGDVLIETTVSEVLDDGVVIHADAETLKHIMEFIKKQDKPLPSKPSLSDKPKPREKTDREIQKILYKDDQKPLGPVQESAHYKTQDEAEKYAKNKVKSFTDKLDGIEIWKTKDGYDVCNTWNSNGRESIQRRGGKKITTIYPSTKEDISEAKYQGREVPLGKPFLTPDGPKKRSVYVKNPKGNIVKVNFGDKNMKIKKSNPKRRKSFRARHNCDNPGPRWKARYWSCRAW